MEGERSWNMIIKGIGLCVWRAGTEVIVGVGGIGCKIEKERKESIKWNKLKNTYNKVQVDFYSEISGQLFDRTHNHFLTKWSFWNRENCANFLYKNCFFLLFYSFYVKITQFLKVTDTLQNPPWRDFFFSDCSVLHEPLITRTENPHVYLCLQ